jgi:hypothetical protein
MIIEIWDRDYTQRLAILEEGERDSRFTLGELEYSSDKWGYMTASFVVVRDTRRYWEELEDTNRVVILHRDEVWAGEIEGVSRGEGSFRVECVGPSARLVNQGTTADLDLNLEAGEKGSDYITDHIVSDEDLGLVAGTIDTDDFAIVTGLDFFPGKSYRDILEEINTFNGWRPQCWGWALDWKPLEKTALYYVRYEDCEPRELNRTREPVKNWCQWAYSTDGSVYGYVTSEDTESQELHGKRCYWGSVSGMCSEAEAQEIADVFIEENKDLKPTSSLTTDKVYDRYGGKVDPEDVKAGNVVMIENLLPTEEAISGDGVINEVSTWEIAEARYKDGKVSISPGDPLATVDVLLAQISNRSRSQ